MFFVLRNGTLCKGMVHTLYKGTASSYVPFLQDLIHMYCFLYRNGMLCKGMVHTYYSLYEETVLHTASSYYFFGLYIIVHLIFSIIGMVYLLMLLYIGEVWEKEKFNQLHKSFVVFQPSNFYLPFAESVHLPSFSLLNTHKSKFTTPAKLS